MITLFINYPAIWNLGPTEIVLILLIAVLLFGGRLPDVARTLGKGFFDFKKNLRDLQDDIYRQDVPRPKNLPKPYYQEDKALEQQEPTPIPSPEKTETKDSEIVDGEIKDSDAKNGDAEDSDAEDGDAEDGERSPDKQG